MTHNLDTEYLILENIYDSGERKTALRQRDLAVKTGTSLGLTNAILKRLAQKGLITIKKFSQRNTQYAITLEGINEIIQRSYNYFKRTIKNTVYYKETLDKIIHEAKLNNVNAVILIGTSDLDFIIEYACNCYGISYLKTANPEIQKNSDAGTLSIYAETFNSFENTNYYQAAEERYVNTLYLSKLLMRQGVCQ